MAVPDTAAEELRLHFVRALDGEKATAVNRRDSPFATILASPKRTLIWSVT
jgi:hypothetical protein